MYLTNTMKIAGAVMSQRRRRWPNIETVLAECLV